MKKALKLKIVPMLSKIRHEHAVADNAQVLRLTIYDSRHLRPKPADNTIFFTPATGRGVRGDAPPGIVSFLDYHWRGDTIYLDFIATRKDRRCKGYACRLLDALFFKYPDVALIDFGGVQSPVIWQYYERKASAGAAVQAHDWYEEEGEDEDEDAWY